MKASLSDELTFVREYLKGWGQEFSKFREGELNSMDEQAQEAEEADIEPYREEPVETVELPRSKWVCDNHYIHVFNDDQDKNECLLTDQLLQIRNALVPMFPDQDLFKPGKKPSGFAKMLLNEWLQLYPGT